MATNVSLLLGLITSCLLMTGCHCLECFACQDPDFGCSKPDKINCAASDNLCRAISFSGKAGNQEEKITWKGCGTGFQGSVVSGEIAYGIQIKSSLYSCNSTACNDKVIDLIPQTQATTPSGFQCYSCFSTNKSKCSTPLAEPVNCSAGYSTCYEATGSLTIGNTRSNIFVKQCSIPTNVTTIEISEDWYKISLTALYCTENNCNENLAPPTKLPEVPTTRNSNTVTTTSVKTTSGIGRTYPSYVAMIILVAMESIL